MASCATASGTLNVMQAGSFAADGWDRIEADAPMHGVAAVRVAAAREILKQRPNNRSKIIAITA